MKILAMLVNARSERHFQTLSGYFGYCQISLNAEKIIIFPIFFCKSGVLTRLCCNLAICDKITRFAVFFFWQMIFVGYHFRALKAIKLTFPLVNMQCKRCHWIHESPFRITLQKRANFIFSMQNRIDYSRWTAGLIVVTNSFLTGTKNDRYGKSVKTQFEPPLAYKQFHTQSGFTV